MNTRGLISSFAVVVLLGFTAGTLAQDAKSSAGDQSGVGTPSSRPNDTAPKGKSQPSASNANRHTSNAKAKRRPSTHQTAADRDSASDKTDAGTPNEKVNGDSSNPKSHGESSQDKPDATKPKTEKATFGGGCFWCMEAVFERIKGVKSVVSGYAGGNVPFPSYEMVHTGMTGHAEVIQIEYDPEVVSYERLLADFFAAHNPTTPNSQGDDFGPQYRSVIFYHNDAQKDAAQKMLKELTARRRFRAPIVTQLAPMTEFYPAELYHQDYYRRNPYSDYSIFHIMPKLKNLKLK
jgi:peptide-methionine (S)-S-oxide reductase